MQQEQVTSGLKSISDLLDYHFFIPSYQRGYRWSQDQVKDLLDDLLEFHRSEKSKNEFYCLQPIVVLKDDELDRFIVIDGQQRLTTLHIILSYLKDIVNLLGKKRYRIDYQTRLDSEVFLNSIDPALKNQNIDYFHMVQAYETIESWFTDKDGSVKLSIANSILGNEGNIVKVIWYELDHTSNPIEVFTRLNMGKIGLTNAELIKALFLSSANKMDKKEANDFKKKQHELSSEWDFFESQLRDDEFWGFLQNNRIKYTNHIELLFDLKANNLTSFGDKKDKDPYFTFRYFFSKINSLSDAWREWAEIKAMYQQFHDWYSDREWYHLIGYLISVGEDLGGILRSTQSFTKSEFIIFLKAKIKSRVAVDKISTMTFVEDKKSIGQTLLLFNVLSILANPKSNLRFQFGRYKEENWDIEHIHSVSSEMPESKAHKTDWLKEVLLFKAKDENEEIQALKKDIQSFLDGEKQIGFESIYNNVVVAFSAPGQGIKHNDVNDISNLTLLDASTNRGYKNAVFPIKRKVIIRKDQTGTFIPLCTKNVFLKYYTQEVEQNTFWGEKDRTAYKNTIIKTLTDYFDGNHSK
jgi:hypothetical protein